MMGIIGGYSLHLYCDCPEHDRYDAIANWPEEIAGDSLEQCKRIARKAGWRFPKGNNKNVTLGVRKCICPECATKAQEKIESTEGATR